MSFLQPRNINRKVLKLSNPTSTTSAPILKTFHFVRRESGFGTGRAYPMAMVNFTAGMRCEVRVASGFGIHAY